jgi:hypothetical protein
MRDIKPRVTGMGKTRETAATVASMTAAENAAVTQPDLLAEEPKVQDRSAEANRF